MSTEITTAFVKQYTDNIRLLQQQMGSSLRGAVSVESNIVGDRAFFDQVDATAMSQITNRHGDTQYTDTPHRRRMVTMAPFEVADLIDRSDKIRTLNDPTNTYVRAFAAAANRQIDDTIIAAFDATAATGVDGSGSDAFDSAYEVAVGSPHNLTTGKLRAARRILEAAENHEDDGDNQWYVICSANNRDALLGDTQFMDSDFNSVKALVDGAVDTWLGFKFLKSERLPRGAGNVESVFAWSKQSMKLAIGQDTRGFIDVLPGKRHSTQIRYEMDMGAVRMDQKGVVRILCDRDIGTS